jgi:hypothetical protein
MTHRYPELEWGENPEKHIIHSDEIITLLSEVYSRLAQRNSKLQLASSSFIKSPDILHIVTMCNLLFDTIPMQLNGRLNSLVTTQEQIDRFLKEDFSDIGDCKFLTIIAAYICSVLLRLPVVISIRHYSGHPILYITLQDQVYKISFLHTGARVDIFQGDNPFDLTENHSYDSDFHDEDLPYERLILYWKVSNAIFVLDAMNILRRCVVNYAQNPQDYSRIFKEVTLLLKNSGIYHNSIVSYWEGEMDRVSSLWQDPRVRATPENFAIAVEKSLRFTND